MVEKALVVVDFQNDFVNGSLGFPEAPALEEPIHKKMEAYRKEEQEIIFTFDTHHENYLETLEGKKLPIPHCLEGYPGWQIYGKLASLLDPEETPVFCKETFGSLSLAEYLRQKKFDQVEFVGLVSNICIISNAVLAKAALPEAEIIVDAACTASYDEDLHNKALDVMEGLHITVINR